MRRRTISEMVIGLSFILIAIGVARGEVLEVFIKAINICLECIGIG